MITTMHSDQNASPPRVEVITSVQRRRRWPTAEKIRLVESTPDTVVCCETGERFMVKETLHEVVQRAIEYGRLLRRPLTE